jgi:glucans biosynthesis protein C
MQTHLLSNGRQFGLDWLRIGAFGLLIFYHIGMFFVPWGWHVKTNDTVAWIEWPMMIVNPWRLSLLFLISGIVSQSLLSKLGGAGAFASSRSWRLLVPLAAAMALFVAPQPWVELTDQGKYRNGFLFFWLHDYAEFGDSLGLVLPTWNHLWFVAYLWTYTMVLATGAMLLQPVSAAIQRVFDTAFSGWRLLVFPVAWLFLAKTILAPRFGETHALVDDPYAHAVYGFAFFFGFGLAKSASTWAQIDRRWALYLGTALAACGLMVAFSLAEPKSSAIDLAKAAARSVLAWMTILGLLGLARAHLHHDGPVRRYLSEAIFPFYIAHQTIIVVVGFGLKQLKVGVGLEFVGILVATVLGCFFTFEIARRLPWLRPLLGLKLEPQRQ